MHYQKALLISVTTTSSTQYILLLCTTSETEVSAGGETMILRLINWIEMNVYGSRLVIIIPYSTRTRLGQSCGSNEHKRHFFSIWKLKIWHWGMKKRRTRWFSTYLDHRPPIMPVPTRPRLHFSCCLRLQSMLQGSDWDTTQYPTSWGSSDKRCVSFDNWKTRQTVKMGASMLSSFNSSISMMKTPFQCLTISDIQS